MSEEIFKNKAPDFALLRKFGFVPEKENYVYCRKIMCGQFRLTVSVSAGGKVRTKLTDTDTEDEYILHKVAAAAGEFVGRVREEYNVVLREIADTCFKPEIYHNPVICAVIKNIKEKYGDEQEFLWRKFPEDSIFRRKDNGRWYVLFLTIARDKIDLEGKDKIEILDVRATPENLKQLVDGKNYFSGYHMNKKHWLTIVPASEPSLSEILRLVAESYRLAGLK